MTRQQVAALRTALTPVLPTGFRTFAEFEHAAPDPFAEPPPPFVL